MRHAMRYKQLQLMQRCIRSSMHGAWRGHSYSSCAKYPCSCAAHQDLAAAAVAAATAPAPTHNYPTRLSQAELAPRVLPRRLCCRLRLITAHHPAVHLLRWRPRAAVLRLICRRTVRRGVKVWKECAQRAQRSIFSDGAPRLPCSASSVQEARRKGWGMGRGLSAWLAIAKQ